MGIYNRGKPISNLRLKGQQISGVYYRSQQIWPTTPTVYLTIDEIPDSLSGSPEVTGLGEEVGAEVLITIYTMNPNSLISGPYSTTVAADKTWTLPAGTIVGPAGGGLQVGNYLVQANATMFGSDQEVDTPLAVIYLLTVDPYTGTDLAPEVTGTISLTAPHAINISILVENQVIRGPYAVVSNNGTWSLPQGSISPNLFFGDFTVVAETSVNQIAQTGSGTLKIVGIVANDIATSDTTPVVNGLISHTPDGQITVEIWELDDTPVKLEGGPAVLAENLSWTYQVVNPLTPTG